MPRLRQGRAYRLLVLLLICAGGGWRGLRAETVGKWRRHVVSLTNSTYAGNPFELEVEATFTHTASGTQITLPGYYAGADAWRIAFMPTRTGEWTWVTSSGDPDLDGQTGSVDTISSSSHGMLASDATHPRKWRYTDGDYVVPIGVFIQIMHGAGSTAEFEAMADFLQTNNLQLINFRLCEQDICFSDVGALKMDLALWDRLEERLEILAERDLGVDIMLYTDDGGKPSYAGQSATEQFLIRYMVARLASFPVVLFNTGIDIWEYRDSTWHDWYGNFVKSLDPYDHPVSSRGSSGSDESFMSAGVRTYNSVGDRNSVIGQLLDAFDADSVPAANNDNWGEQRTGINGHTPEDIRRAGWKGTIAGGVGFHVRHNENNDCANGVTSNCDNPFTVAGIAEDLDSEQWLALVNPFVNTRLGASFGEMVPEPGLVGNGYALADPGRFRILYFLMGVNDSWDSGNGGQVTLKLDGLPATYDAIWLDSRTGVETDIGSFAGGSQYLLDPPSTDDWVLLLAIDAASTRSLLISPTPVDGMVSSKPSGISCGGDCAQDYLFGLEVELRATPGFDSEFAGWGGDADCSDGNVVMVVDTTCSADFQACTIPSSVELPPETVTEPKEFQACNQLSAGTGGFVVAAPGDVVFRAGNLIVLEDGFDIMAGGRFRAEIGPPQP
jgi:hypothetical protein